MHDRVLIRFVKQLNDELDIIDRTIANLEKLRRIYGGESLVGRPRKVEHPRQARRRKPQLRARPPA